MENLITVPSQQRFSSVVIQNADLSSNFEDFSAYDVEACLYYLLNKESFHTFFDGMTDSEIIEMDTDDLISHILEILKHKLQYFDQYSNYYISYTFLAYHAKDILYENIKILCYELIERIS